MAFLIWLISAVLFPGHGPEQGRVHHEGRAQAGQEERRLERDRRGEEPDLCHFAFALALVIKRPKNLTPSYDQSCLLTLKK